jgi:hypothetical protein
MNMPARSSLDNPFGRSRAADLAFLHLALSLAMISLQWVLRMAHHGATLTDEGFSVTNRFEILEQGHVDSLPIPKTGKAIGLAPPDRGRIDEV